MIVNKTLYDFLREINSTSCRPVSLVPAQMGCSEAASLRRVLAGTADSLWNGVDRVFKREHEPQILEQFKMHFNRIPWLQAMYFGLENAFLHGNGNDPEKEVQLDVHDGASGLVMTITDQGKGFDYEKVSRQVVKYTREIVKPQVKLDAAVRICTNHYQGRYKYFKRGGGGFFEFHVGQAEVAFAEGGRTVLICYSRRNKKLFTDESHPFMGITR